MNQGAEADGRVEDIVVVAHHEIDFSQEIEADLEGTDYVFLCGLEYVVRILVRVLPDQGWEQLGAGELEPVLLGIGTELLVADDFGVGAHLGFGAQLEAAEEVVLHCFGGLDCDPLLEGLGGQEKNPLASSEGCANGRVEDGRSLPATRRGPNQEVPPIGESALDGVTDFRL